MYYHPICWYACLRAWEVSRGARCGCFHACLLLLSKYTKQEGLDFLLSSPFSKYKKEGVLSSLLSLAAVTTPGGVFSLFSLAPLFSRSLSGPTTDARWGTLTEGREVVVTVGVTLTVLWAVVVVAVEVV
jgi:hypothetical protein